ncbi:hypothetical protein AG1IA_08028 [Rhizoctonia solani AG-1 IA]|uniref:Uncharacterized protein n=1 Tax=Thanatephorus cucumeris (strain AG1-IA) TaxID=983506 RepID=L8WME2_THACA|nr:hypothetical protein AG1IA_08028 [Rhizoctonia solani AG-1 IA]
MIAQRSLWCDKILKISTSVKDRFFTVGYGLKITMLVCLPQHESDYRRIDT